MFIVIQADHTDQEPLIFWPVGFVSTAVRTEREYEPSFQILVFVFGLEELNRLLTTVSVLESIVSRRGLPIVAFMLPKLSIASFPLHLELYWAWNEWFRWLVQKRNLRRQVGVSSPFNRKFRVRLLFPFELERSWPQEHKRLAVLVGEVE